MSRDSELAEFDVARGEWESAFASVPDEALAYLKPGDDYALGGLQVHVNWVLLHYSRVLDGIIAGNFGRLEPQDSPGEAASANRRAKAGLAPGERRKSVDDMEGLHAAVRGAAAKMPAGDWSRQAPVIYGAGQEPYQTSPEEIVGWLRDHYREHVHQSADLIEEWRTLRAATGDG
jgi:hypothetical protein